MNVLNPTDEIREHVNQIRNKMGDTRNREISLAMTKLDEFELWFEKAITKLNVQD